jgi:SHS2 domain-containing protein
MDEFIPKAAKLNLNWWSGYLFVLTSKNLLVLDVSEIETENFTMSVTTFTDGSITEYTPSAVQIG